MEGGGEQVVASWSRARLLWGFQFVHRNGETARHTHILSVQVERSSGSAVVELGWRFSSRGDRP